MFLQYVATSLFTLRRETIYFCFFVNCAEDAMPAGLFDWLVCFGTDFGAAASLSNATGGKCCRAGLSLAIEHLRSRLLRFLLSGTCFDRIYYVELVITADHLLEFLG